MRSNRRGQRLEPAPGNQHVDVDRRTLTTMMTYGQTTDENVIHAEARENGVDYAEVRGSLIHDFPEVPDNASAFHWCIVASVTVSRLGSTVLTQAVYLVKRSVLRGRCLKGIGGATVHPFDASVRRDAADRIPLRRDSFDSRLSPTSAP